MVYSVQLNALLEELEDSGIGFIDMIDNIPSLEIHDEQVEALRIARSYVSDMQGRLEAVLSSLRPSTQTWRPSLPSISETETQNRDEGVDIDDDEDVDTDDEQDVDTDDEQDVDTDDDVMQPSAIMPNNEVKREAVENTQEDFADGQEYEETERLAGHVAALGPDKPKNGVEQAARDAQIARLRADDKAPAKQCRVAEGHLPRPGSSASDVNQEADALPTSNADDTAKTEKE